MKQNELKVSFYLKKSEVNAEGRCPVMARLSVGKYSETGFSAKMSVPESLWVSGRAIGKSTAAREINRQLDEIRASALNIYEELLSIRDGVRVEDVKCQLLGMASGQQTLLTYFMTFIEHFEKRVGVNRKKGTAQSYRYAYKCLASFLQAKCRLRATRALPPMSVLIKYFCPYRYYLLLSLCSGQGGNTLPCAVSIGRSTLPALCVFPHRVYPSGFSSMLPSEPLPLPLPEPVPSSPLRELTLVHTTFSPTRARVTAEP